MTEAYFVYPTPWGEISAGKKIFNWSVTDEISPGDFLSPRDWTDLLRPEKTGVPSVSVKWGGSERFLEAVYIPRVTPSRLPRGNWAPGLSDGVTLLPRNIDKNRPQWALRGNMSMAGWDIGASLYDGISYNPLAKAQLTRQGLLVTPFYPEIKAGVFSLTGDVLGSIVRFKSGYFQQAEGDNFWSHVAGVEREFSGLLGRTDHLHLLLQYADESVTSEDPSVLAEWVDFRRLFSNNVMGRLTYHFTDLERWAIEGEATHNLDQDDGFLEFSVSRKIDLSKASVELLLGVDVCYGEPSTFWGRFEDNDQLFFMLSLIM